LKVKLGIIHLSSINPSSSESSSSHPQAYAGVATELLLAMLGPRLPYSFKEGSMIYGGTQTLVDALHKALPGGRIPRSIEHKTPVLQVWDLSQTCNAIEPVINYN